MSSFDNGAVTGLLVAAAIVAWILWAEFRIRSLQSKLISTEELVKDANIQRKIHSLSDSDLNKSLAKSLIAGQTLSKPE